MVVGLRKITPAHANLATPIHVQSPVLATHIVAYEVLITAVHKSCTTDGVK